MYARYRHLLAPCCVSAIISNVIKGGRDPLNDRYSSLAGAAGRPHRSSRGETAPDWSEAIDWKMRRASDTDMNQAF
jgi:hypothetical protein